MISSRGHRYAQTNIYVDIKYKLWVSAYQFVLYVSIYVCMHVGIYLRAEYSMYNNVLFNALSVLVYNRYVQLLF